MTFRSLLFVPGNKRRMIESAANSEADVILFDVEDSVPTAPQKQAARALISEYVAGGSFMNRNTFVRVNSPTTGELLKDIEAFKGLELDGFMYPKARCEGDINFFCRLLSAIESESQVQEKKFAIIPLIETTAALRKIDAICMASPRISSIAFGSEDFMDDLRGIHDEQGLALAIPRATIPIAARAHNLRAIDTVHLEVHNSTALAKRIETSKRLGYQGMLALHPCQVGAINSGYGANPADIRKAEKIVLAFEEAMNEKESIALMDGELIGPPMYKAALKLLADAKRD